MALADVALIERQPANSKVAGLTPGQGTVAGLRARFAVQSV